MKKENIFDLYAAQHKDEPEPNANAERVPGEVKPEDVAPAQEVPAQAPAQDPEPKQEPAQDPEPKQEPAQNVGGDQNGV